jgi:hypothetical protein
MRYFVSILVLVAVVLFPKGIAAQAPNNSPIPINIRTVVEERIERNDEKREEIRLKLEDNAITRETKREELKIKLEKQAQNRIQALFGRVITRIESAISRLDTLIGRMEARLEIFANEGESVEEIEEDIGLARDLLEDAEALLEELKTSVDDMIPSEDPKAGYIYIKDAVKNIKSNLVEVHSILVQIIGDMKGLRVGVTENI